MQEKSLPLARGVLFVSLWMTVAGCTSERTANPAAASNTPASSASLNASAGADAAKAREIAVQLVSWAGLEEWIQEQRGKVVVIDVWSTYCAICMKEFPHFVALHERHQAQVACASLSIDYYGGEGNEPESVQPQVLQFLQSQQATTKNFIATDPDTEVLKQISTSAIPAALVYDRTGKLHTIFNNDRNEYGEDGFTYEEQVEPLVQSLIQP